MEIIGGPGGPGGIGLSAFFSLAYWLEPQPGMAGPLLLVILAGLLGTLAVNLLDWWPARRSQGWLAGPARWVSLAVVVLAGLGAALVVLRFLGVPYLSARGLIAVDLLALAGLSGYLTLTSPMTAKELRSRMRGWRAFATMTCYLAALGGFAWLIFQMVAAQQAWDMGPQAAFAGKSIMLGIAIIELFLVCFITPAFTAGTIAGEKERQTYDLLVATPLPPRSIVLGKLFAALAYILLLIITAIPLQSLAFLLGGVAPDELIVVSALLLITAITFGMVGIFFSSLLGSSSTATVLSYVVVLALVIGSPMAYSFSGVVTRTQPSNWLVYPNPFYALSSAVGNNGGYMPYLGPFSVFLSIAPMMVEPAVMEKAVMSAVGPDGRAIDSRLSVVQTEPERPIWERLFANMPPWKHYVVIYSSLSLLLLGASFLLVRPRRRLFRRPW